MTVVIDGTTGISPVTAAGTSALVDGITVGRGAGGGQPPILRWVSSALATNSTGAQNTAVGIDALKLATDSLNTAVGTNSLQTQSTGYRNTAVGAQSFPVSTTGIDNVAVGTYAGNGYNYRLFQRCGGFKTPLLRRHRQRQRSRAVSGGLFQRNRNSHFSDWLSTRFTTQTQQATCLTWR
jgi:hypothetical protein